MTEEWLARRYQENKHRPDDKRSPYQKDRSRIIHAAAFRRLQAKTQIMGIGVNDFYRTRLTHSLEVAQIASGILGQLRANPSNASFSACLPCRSLIETLSLAHDIGHPPFGHGGETALNYMMRAHGGFEGNAQTLRIVAKLEPYSKGYGMNLTRRTLLGFIKYPQLIKSLWKIPHDDGTDKFINSTRWLPAKGLYCEESAVFDWVLAPLSDTDKSIFTSFAENANGVARTQYKSLDCAIMELADDIAYGVHDLEDAIATGMVSQHQWHEFVANHLSELEDGWLKTNLPRISAQLFSRDEADLKEVIGELVNLFITQAKVKKLGVFDSPLLDHSVYLEKELFILLEGLKQFVFRNVIRHPEMQQIEFKGQKIISDLFAAFASDPLRLLPHTRQTIYQAALENGETGYRQLCDYISSMTDEYAIKVHGRLFTTEY
ncbi:anti-phage deoxyguanosine triphosphatase [Pseudoalteromonas spongiae]|uniref:Deoxyguanosinetriphosphate triphosphohydrolase-like protein n=1 Tax=Pseudoalteromonas spongiae TaxID=298657 RepID=A0ABU8ERL5_9GAMM